MISKNKSKEIQTIKALHLTHPLGEKSMDMIGFK
jgi:hypothetical protein